MNPVAPLLSPADVILDLDASGQGSLFDALGKFFACRHGLPCAQVVDALRAREKLSSTGLGRGVAIPHARIRGLRKAIAAFVRTRVPIPFDAPDGKPVSAMVVLLVPERATESHLELLALIAQMLGDRQFRDALRTCVDAVQASRLFADWPQG